MTVPPRTRKPRISVEARRLFLETIAAGWSAERAAEVSSVAKQRFYELRAQDGTFAQAWQDAYETGTDVLRDELRRRATEGFTETVLDANGKVIRRTERMNPADLHLELKRRDPSYKEGAQVGIALNGGPPSLDQIRHERGLTLADVAAMQGSQEIQDAINRFKEGIIRLAERRALTAQDIRDVHIIEKLEDVGLIDGDGVPVHMADAERRALMPGAEWPPENPSGMSSDAGVRRLQLNRNEREQR